MDAFLEAHDADDEAQRNVLCKKHASSVRTHVGILKSKGYQDNFEQSPEFVVLFLPNEAVYSTALEHDPKLIEDGAVENVIIATPTTLIALLKAVAYGWRQEKIADEVKKFSDLGREFYERLATVTKHITNVGKSIDQSVTRYNTMVGSIEGRLIPTAKKFHDSNLVGDSKKKLVEPSRIDHSVRDLSELSSLEDPAVLKEDLAGISDDFEEEFGKLRIADAAGGSGE
jgi:DNA recombination protein RmuC